MAQFHIQLQDTPTPQITERLTPEVPDLWHTARTTQSQYQLMIHRTTLLWANNGTVYPQVPSTTAPEPPHTESPHTTQKATFYQRMMRTTTGVQK